MKYRQQQSTQVEGWPTKAAKPPVTKS